MALPVRLYVDTNIFIRLFEAKGDVSEALAELFLRAPRAAAPFLATSELTLAELLVGVFRQRNDRLIDLYGTWANTNPYVEAGPVDRLILRSAAVLRARYGSLRLPDAIHLATALHMRCSHLLTDDLKLRGTYELFNHHWGLTIGPAAVEIVRPDVEYVRALAGAPPG